MTASTLYEAVEPQIIWKRVLTAIVPEIVGDGTNIEVCEKEAILATNLRFLIGNSLDVVHFEDIFFSGRGSPKYTFAYRIFGARRDFECKRRFR
jgi:hypothetical protein